MSIFASCYRVDRCVYQRCGSPKGGPAAWFVRQVGVSCVIWTMRSCGRVVHEHRVRVGSGGVGVAATTTACPDALPGFAAELRLWDQATRSRGCSAATEVTGAHPARFVPASSLSNSETCRGPRGGRRSGHRERDEADTVIDRRRSLAFLIVVSTSARRRSSRPAGSAICWHSRSSTLATSLGRAGDDV